MIYIQCIIHSTSTGYTHKIQIIHKIVVWIREMLRNKWEKCTWLWDETMQMYGCWRNKEADNRTDNKTQLSNGMNNLHSNNQELSSLSSENISFLILEFFFFLLLISLSLYSLFKPTNSINPILTTVDRVKFVKRIKFPSLQTNFSSTTNELQIESLENLDNISMEFNLSKEIKEILLIRYSICIS